MRVRLLFTIILLAAFIACSKDKFTTIPQLKVKSVNSSFIPSNGTLRITFKFTDKEGDIDDSLIVVRERINRNDPFTSPASPYKIPEFPDKNQGDIIIALDYNFGLTFGIQPIRIPGSDPPRNEPDTMNLKFIARDKAGNKSDAVTVRNIIVIR